MSLRHCRPYGLAALVALLTACSSTPPQYFTLAGEAGKPTTGPLSPIAVEFLPIAVPEQADQAQVMVRTGEQEFTPDYNALWAASLSEEVRSGIASSLYGKAGIADLTSLAAGHDGPLWRLQIRVQVFDLPARGPVALDALWRARRVDSGAAGAGGAWACRGQFRAEPQAPGVPGLVAAQRQAVDALATQIAVALAAPTDSAPADCRWEAPAASAAKPATATTPVRP